MSNYKVVDADQLDADLTTVANAIRERAGTSAKMDFPSGFKDIVNSIPNGVELPELGDTAAQPTDMLAGKVLYDDNGNPITGTLLEANEIQEKIWATSDYSFGGTAGGTTFNVSGMYNGSSGVPDGLVVRTGAGLGIRHAPTDFFGDAMPGDVAKGKKFTSAAGLLVEGTMEPASASPTVVQIAEDTPTANSLTLTFNGLSGEPTLFSINPKENITLGSTRYILGVCYDGNATMGTIGYSNGSWGSSATAAYSASNFTWEYYADGMLIVTSNGATTGGYFMNGITYQLTYITS